MTRRRRGSRYYAQLDPKKWARARRAAFERDGWRCRKCGAPGALEGHHVVSLEAGGDMYDLDNVISWCRNCHIRHHNPISPEVAAWKALVKDLIN